MKDVKVHTLVVSGMASLLVLVGGCGGDSEGGRSIMDGSDPGAGTGSAGGNPLVIGFDVSDHVVPGLEVQPPEAKIGTHAVEPFVVDAAGVGACSGELGAPVELNFDSSREPVFLMEEIPCTVLLKPHPEGPLLRIQAALAQRGVTLDYDLAEGIFIDVRDPMGLSDALGRAYPDGWSPEGLSPDELQQYQTIFVLFDPEAFRVELDLAQLVEAMSQEGPIRVDDSMDEELRAAFRAALVASVRIYLDPTPGDGELTLDEQVDANVVATVRLNE